MFDKKHGLRPCAVAFAVAMALGLSACGGGGGANVRPTTPPPPPPVDPGFTGGQVNVDAGDTLAWPDDIGGPIDLIKGGAGTLVLTGTDTYTGGTTIDEGTLQVGDGGTTGSIVGDVTDNGLLRFDRSDNVTFNGIVSGNGALEQAGKGMLVLTGNNIYTGGTTISRGILQIGNGGTGGSIVGDVANSGSLVFNRSDNVSFNGIVSGSGALEQAGKGTLALTGNNTYTGGTTISRGILQIGNGGTGGSIVGDVANSGSLVFNRSDNVSFNGIVSGSGALQQAGKGMLTLTGNSTYTGGTTISRGILQIGDGGTAGSIVGDVTNNGSLVFNRSDNVIFGGIVSGNGSLVQAGKGTLTLTGANTYIGSTQINSGSLYIDGDQSIARGKITVTSGATLGGKGILGGNVTADNGATLAPGSKGATGTLTINGDLALSAGSILDYSFGQTSVANGQFNDLINVNGDLVLDGTLNISAATDYALSAGVYRLFNYVGTLTNSGLAMSGPLSSDTLAQTGVAKQVNLVSTQGMSVSFWDGDAGPKGNNAIDGGNGTWKSGSSLTANNWTDANGATNASFEGRSFAIFQSTPGTVTVDDGNGDIDTAGMQFASDGYVVQGDSIHLVGSAGDSTHSIIRVGDGTTAGASYKATINSVLDGDSTLVKTDVGTLVLGGANVYTGGTTISSGTLQVGNGSTTGSIAGDVKNNGTLAFNHSNDMSFDGLVSGAGSLVQAGTGKLTLTGANTYSGGTTIDNGTLQVGNYGLSGSIIGNVTNNGSLVFSRSDDTSFAGIISGSGSLVKNGDGKLTLTGAHTYTGGTDIGGGTLEIAPGASLGTGSITVGVTSPYYSPKHILQVDSGVSLPNQIVLNGGTLDNAGILGGALDTGVKGTGPLATILNHDSGSIRGNDSAIALAFSGTVENSSGGTLEGGSFGVTMGDGGMVSNDGAGSIIRSAGGIAIQVLGESGTVENIGGGTITSGLTSIYLQHGGSVSNGAGSTIEATGARNGDCGSGGICSIFVASGDSTVSTFDGGLTLNNAGTITGNVQMLPTSHNSATLSAGGSIRGDLLMGSNDGSFLTLNGDPGTTQLYSQAVTGKTTFAGLFFKKGDGTWIIDNNDLNTVTHTEISGGVLQVGDGGTKGSIGQSVVQVENGALVFDHSDDVTFGGQIVGPGLADNHGSLVQAGTGKLILTNDSLQSGNFNVTIKSGTLQLGNGGDRGFIGGGWGSTQPIVNDGSLIFDRSFDLTFNDMISGTGSVTQQGSNQLILGRANTYTGGTTVSNGTLLTVEILPGDVVVGTAGELGGYRFGAPAPGLPGVAGNLSNAGKVFSLIGNSWIGGNYTQASTGTFAVNLGSQMQVMGTATLNGGTLEVIGANDGYISNTHTTVLTAGTGITGTFDQLVKDSGVVFTATTINYDANSVWLDTTGLDVTTAAAGQGVSYTAASMGSAQRVQGAFEQLNSKIAAGKTADVSSDFVQTAGQFQQAPTLQSAQASLRSLSGQLHAASAAMTFKAIDASSRALSDRFDSLLDRDAGFGMWMQNLNVGGGMARAGFDGVDFQLNGWLVGSDRRIGHSGVAGYAFGQSRGQQRLDQGFDRDNSRSTEGMMYAGWLNGNWYTQGRVGFGRFQQDVSRQLLLGDSMQGVRTRYDGNYDVAYGESGLHFGRGNGHLTPFVNVQYARIDRDGFAEQGAGGFGLRSNAQAVDRWQAGVGVRAGRHWDLDRGRSVDFSARAQWQRTLASHGDVFDASFVGMQQWQPLTGIGLSRYGGLIGVGLDAALSARTTLKFGYDYETGQRDKAQTMSARLNVAF